MECGNAGIRWCHSSFVGPTECCGWRGPPNQSRQRDERQQVRDHLYELCGQDLRTLQLDLQRFCGREEQARDRGTHRFPAAEDHRRECNEAATGGHLVAELMLIESKVDATEGGKYARQCNGDVAQLPDRESRGYGSLG